MARPGNSAGRSVIAMLPQLTKDFGAEPPYCPWRAYWEPLVVEALTLRGRGEHVDYDTQPAVVVEALAILSGTQQRLEAAQRKREAKDRDAKNKAAGHH